MSALLDPGLLPGNPLDVWGTGADTRRLFSDCLRAMADDSGVGALALAVDFVREFDGVPLLSSAGRASTAAAAGTLVIATS